MANRDRTSEAAEEVVKIARDSYREAVDHAVELQERNVRFAQGLVEDSIRSLRTQSKRNWELVEELFERTEEQSDAVLRVVEESIDAYVDFLYPPFSYHKRA